MIKTQSMQSRINMSKAQDLDKTFVKLFPSFTCHHLITPGCKESQFYSLPFGQTVASMY